MTTTATDDTLQAPRIGRYQIDRRGSTITFKSRHLFELDTTSFDTGNGRRDGDVQSPRFLDAGRYPSMTFTSKRLARSEGRWTLTGMLTIRDVARPVSLAIEWSTVTPEWPTSLVVWAATRIDRTEFGIDVSLRILGVRR